MKDSRSGISLINLQETLDASASAKRATLVNLAQYQTPVEFASFCAKLLPSVYCDHVFDPQCAAGNLLNQDFGWHTKKFGFEIDNRYRPGADFDDTNDGVLRVIGNCVTAWEIMDELFPDLRFQCQVANPPFSIGLKVGEQTIDSTEYTWKLIMGKAALGGDGYGYFVANSSTIEKLGIDKHERVYLYQKFPVGIFPNVNVAVGVVHWWSGSGLPCQRLDYTTLNLEEHRPVLDEVRQQFAKFPMSNSSDFFTGQKEMIEAFKTIIQVIEQERSEQPPYNIWLQDNGKLKTYLSVRTQVKRKLTREDIIKLERIRDAHPLALTPDKKTRDLLKELVECGFYTIEPKAKLAIDDALAQAAVVSVPIMDVTDFERVAYLDEEETVICKADWPSDDPVFTAGQKYSLTTDTFAFTEDFTRTKVHYSETEQRMYTLEHRCQLTGTDRYILIRDNNRTPHRFMDRPTSLPGDHDERILWDIFQKPAVQTIAEKHPDRIAHNGRVLKASEMWGDFTYYPGQFSYLARVACKDYALVAGQTGTGKSAMALALIQVKAPKRALIIAPQGTMRSPDDEEEEGTEYKASQWVEEIRRFCPGQAVFELFSMDDYRRIRKANEGQLPHGIYVTYYEAMFSNGARESTPDGWTDDRMNEELQTIMGSTRYSLPPSPAEETGIESERYWCDRVGREEDGIRCIIQPCMSTLVGHYFDMVCLDEAHYACNLNASRTQMLIRLQPRFRYAFTATPIPNIVTNLFSLFGWLCVPDWYKGDRRSAAWPYARGDQQRFASTFLTTERDFTEEARKKEADKKWKGKCEKLSPLISQPARLLKILRPTMAFITKMQCNPDYQDAKLTDIRVPFGEEQMRLYAHFLNRRNIIANHPLVRARKQIAYLRGICADPAGFTHGGPRVHSNFNPKTMAALELIQKFIAEGEPVVIICARIGQTDTLVRMVREMGIRHSRIDSTVPADRHSSEANLFKAGKTQILFMGIKCAASHSFAHCRREIILSLEYSYGSLDQARGRIDRVNSRKDVEIYCILHKHSIEETMFSCVSTKQDSATLCLHGSRIPRDYKPLDLSEVLALSIANFNEEGTVNELDCQNQWAELRKR